MLFCLHKKIDISIDTLYIYGEAIKRERRERERFSVVPNQQCSSSVPVTHSV